MVDSLVLWVLPASWVVHDLEEVLTVDAWSRRWSGAPLDSASRLQRRLVESLASTSGEFTVAAALVGCVVVGVTVAGTLDPAGVGMSPTRRYSADTGFTGSSTSDSRACSGATCPASSPPC